MKKLILFIVVISSTIIALLLTNSGNSFTEDNFQWGNIRPIIRDTVLALEQYGSITSGIVGIAGKKPRQYDRRKWFMKNAKAEELSLLTKHPHNAIKAMAYEGLLRKPDSNKFNLMKSALLDTTSFFNYQTGCVGNPKLIGEYLAENVIRISNLVPPLPANKRLNYSMDANQIKELDRLYKNIRTKKEEYFSSSLLE